MASKYQNKEEANVEFEKRLNATGDEQGKASEVLADFYSEDSNLDPESLRGFYRMVRNQTHDENGYQRRNVNSEEVQKCEELINTLNSHASDYRKKVITSSMPIEAIKMSLESSIGPRRYQAVLGILVNDCGVSNDALGELETYLGNSEKLTLKFDYKHDPNASESEKEKLEIEEFNKNVLNLLSKDDGKLWERMDKSLREAACKKDLKRIVEKFSPSEELKEGIEDNLKEIYSGRAIEKPFNDLRLILISERLKKKGVREEDATSLAESFVNKTKTVDELKLDPALASIRSKNGEGKIEAIFTKYASFGKIADATQLRKRVVGKIFSQFQEKFSDEIHDLDGIITVEMQGDEVLFRGINSRSGLTGDVIRQQFEDLHIGESVLHGVGQQLGSYRVMQKREVGPGELQNRAAYAVATSANFAVAAKYAGDGNLDSGWIYDIRPKKGKSGVNMHELASTYAEIDFESVDPEEIYAVYEVSRNVVSEGNGKKVSKNCINQVILNPHYKKRAGDEKDLITLNQEIETLEEKSQNGATTFSVNERENDKSIEFLRDQIKSHGARYSSGTHLREATAEYIRTSREETSLEINDERYRKSFHAELLPSDEKSQESANLNSVPKISDFDKTERNEALWKSYLEPKVLFEKVSENSSIRRDTGWNYLEKDGAGNKFKVFISVEHDDASKAIEILIKNGYFDYEELPLCDQKTPLHSQLEDKKGRKAIILYAQGEPTEESSRIWAERLNAIERDFYEAGIKPRPLASQEDASPGVTVNDRKFPGSLYSYYKKDVHSWEWEENNYFEEVKVNVGELIEIKIKEIEAKIVDSESDVERKILAESLKAEKFYLEISKLGPAQTERIQSGLNINEEAKDRIVMQPTRNGDERREVTMERERYFLANNIRRSQASKAVSSDKLDIDEIEIELDQTSPARKIKTNHINIIEAKAQAVVNAGNEVLDRGNYGIGGLSLSIHKDFGYKEAECLKDGETEYYFNKTSSNLANQLVIQNKDVSEGCKIWVGAVDEEGDSVDEKSQAKNRKGNLLFLKEIPRTDNQKVGETRYSTTEEKTDRPCYNQQMLEVDATKLKTGEVAVVEDLASINPESQMVKNGVTAIIHAVGPDCRREEFRISTKDSSEEAEAKINARKEALEKAYEATLNKALEKGIKTIALPALSVGVFKYPEEEAATVIAQILHKYEDKFDEITICAIDPKDKEKRPTILDLIDTALGKTTRTSKSEDTGNKGALNNTPPPSPITVIDVPADSIGGIPDTTGSTINIIPFSKTTPEGPETKNLGEKQKDDEEEEVSSFTGSSTMSANTGNSLPKKNYFVEGKPWDYNEETELLTPSVNVAQSLKTQVEEVSEGVIDTALNNVSNIVTKGSKTNLHAEMLTKVVSGVETPISPLDAAREKLPKIKILSAENKELNIEDVMLEAKISLLDYSAESVLNKANKVAKYAESESVKISAKVFDDKDYYQRFGKKDFEGADLKIIFRNTFTKCTFDERCTLPTDLTQLDKKYFVDCEFSKKLIDTFIKDMSSDE